MSTQPQTKYPANWSLDRMVVERFCELLEENGYDPVTERNADGVEITPREQLRIHGQAWREIRAIRSDVPNWTFDPDPVIDPNL